MGRRDGIKGLEAASDALRKSQALNMEIRSLRKQVERLTRTTRAMWDLLVETGTLTEDRLAGRIAELDEQAKEEIRNGLKEADACPGCSRPLQDNNEVCIYCGLKTHRRRLF